MSRVTMTHPDLPDQPISVREKSVPHYRASGWQVTDDAPTKPPRKAAARRRRQQGDETT